MSVKYSDQIRHAHVCVIASWAGHMSENRVVTLIDILMLRCGILVRICQGRLNVGSLYAGLGQGYEIHQRTKCMDQKCAFQAERPTSFCGHMKGVEVGLWISTSRIPILDICISHEWSSFVSYLFKGQHVN